MERVRVIAGTHQEYKDFLRRHNLSPNQWVYANRREHVMGCRNGKYILVGNYYKNPIYDNEPYIFELYNMQKLEQPQQGGESE